MLRALRSLTPALLLAAAAVAQSSITTTFADNNGRSSPGATTYFDLQATIGLAITALDLNLIAAVGVGGSVDVYTTAPGGTYVGNQTNPAAWTLVTRSANFLAAGRGQPTNAPLNAPVVLAPGTYGIAIVYNGVGVAYTNGTGTNQSYSNADVSLSLGSATASAFGGSLFDPRVFNGTIYYTPGSNFARAVPYGAGCGAAGAPLGLRGVARPVIGTTATAETFAIPAASPSGTVIVGLAPIVPGLDLTPFGMPGCFLHTSTIASLAFAPAGSTASHSLSIPNDPGLAGASLFLQSVVVSVGANPLNLLSSNGLEWSLNLQ